ncbi:MULTISPECIES: hypothetical protein [unclassified Psychrobacter]|uniref:hypothetical protein n=1 Tax=unclassified Psychrobacter TaxID=196806 RepID=UPI00293D9DDF|nr:hypothetical protein [uncultured Psychrobacter sp.]
MTIHKENEQPNNEERVPVDDPVAAKVLNPKDSYEGRKYDPEIDGPEQASQETDEVYSDPRKEENLPAGGKNVADLNAHDLSQNNNI